MKKVLLVLGLVGVTLTSCVEDKLAVEKEEVTIKTCGDYGYTIVGFGKDLVNGYDLYTMEVQDWLGGSFVLTVNKDKWDAYQLEIELNDIACWGN